ncbi:MAG TPA: hypothetical protein VMN57_15270 [Anaerolineales bacterium]|nr:hypothetical protein [Anaerolineales bacterium]
METARRLGYFFLVLAFIFYIASTQAETAGPVVRGQLVVFRILFGLLGIILVTRYRGRARETSRFSWIRNFLFKRKAPRRKKDRQKRGRGETEA